MSAPDALVDLRLLALCTIEGVNWNVIAREAQRPEGLDRLLGGLADETSADAAKTRELIGKELGTLDERIEQVEAQVTEAREAAGARLVTVLHDEYPANLRLIPSPPPFLFYRGELRRADARSVAVVGTRRASEEGKSRAAKLAARLCGQGVTVISGLARGIDTAAHEETLAAGGRTLAVVGTGIMRTYPKENAELAERIADTGAIVSQFWPAAPPTRWSFPMRNAVMSGISQGTAVIEATSRSGAKMQARIALEQGKRAFLMHSLVTDQAWAAKYLDRGAIEVHDVEDVVGWLLSPEQVELQSAQRRQLVLELA